MKKIKFKNFLFSIFHVFFAFHAISNIKKKKIGVKKKFRGGGGGGVKEKQFFLISRFMLFSTLKKNNIEKCPFTYWLNGRWFLQIVDGDSWNLYPLYPLFPDFVSHMWGGGGGGLYVGNIEKCPFTYSYWLNGRWFLQIVDIGHFIMRLEILKKCPFTYWLNGGGGFSKS